MIATVDVRRSATGATEFTSGLSQKIRALRCGVLAIFATGRKPIGVSPESE